MSEKEFKKVLKRKGMKETKYIEYNPKSRGERIALEVGLISKLNKVLYPFGLIMFLSGADREGNYLFKIVKK